MKIFTLLVTGLLFTGAAIAQYNRCGTMENLEMLKQQDPDLEARMAQIESDLQELLTANPEYRTGSVITIPVVFHVLYSSAAHNISDTRLLAQLDVLNKDFAKKNADTTIIPAAFKPFAAGTEIQFCLAKRDPNGNSHTGINRVSTTVTSWSTNNAIKYTAQGGADAWNRNKYLNIWVGNLGGGLLGYAQFPGGGTATDGVVCLYSSVGGPTAPGTANPYHLGRTATHEVGHWLGLYHIWGDATCGNDQVADTPTQQTSNGGCPTYPKLTCGNTTSGDMFMNFMDYTNDACMVMFTAGQGTRMNGVAGLLSASRSALATSNGCQIVVGINEVDQLASLVNIFPNPSNGIFNISTDGLTYKNISISVYNLVGEKIIDLSTLDPQTRNYQINLDELSKGIYQVNIALDNRVVTKRISLVK